MSSQILQQIRLDGRVPEHVAIIMDGNGRWAKARGLPRQRGHVAGMRSVRAAIEGAIQADLLEELRRHPRAQTSITSASLALRSCSILRM